MSEYSFEKIVNHAKNSGFVFQGSEIYGGLSNTWDFGPLGVELKNNIIITRLSKERYESLEKDWNEIIDLKIVWMNHSINTNKNIIIKLNLSMIMKYIYFCFFPMIRSLKTEELIFQSSDSTYTFFVAPNQYDDFVGLLAKYKKAGHHFMWFYPVEKNHIPELPPELEKNIRMIYPD